MAEQGFSMVHLIQLHDTKILYTKSWCTDSYHLWRHLRLGFFPTVWSGMMVRAWSWVVHGSILFTAWRMHYFSIMALVRARHTPANSTWSFPGPTTSQITLFPFALHTSVTTFNFPACSTFQLLSLTLHKTFHTHTPISCHLTKLPVFSPTNFILSLFTHWTSLLNLQTTLFPYHLTKLSVTPPTTHTLLFSLPETSVAHLPTMPLHVQLTKLPVGVHISYNQDLCHILSIPYTQSLPDALNLPICSVYGPPYSYCTAPWLLLACHSSLPYLCNIPPLLLWITWYLDPEDWDSNLPQNIGSYLPIEGVFCPSRIKSSLTPVWEPHTLHWPILFSNSSPDNISDNIIHFLQRNCCLEWAEELDGLASS